MYQEQLEQEGQPDAEAWAPSSYHDAYFDLEAVKVLPGEYYVTRQDKLLVTVLGSCVAACIRDKVQGIGGISHFMLPFGFNEEELIDSSIRYGSHAMEVLINQLLKLGAVREQLEAKVFGGGNVLAAEGSQLIGERNAEFLLSYLNAEQIPIVSQSLLGPWPQKVYFFPTSGRVLVKKLKRLNNTTIFDREARYFEKLLNIEVAGNVELFG
ncbi:chemoreceptor glutamine deamidase CheD [Marinospirillum alkaliphilum]|uniref:Probable chemoreceptor glutamine deamidase CheD n=1 Tax=Marinospirillum alkaliphilum DSM 21637 TaxID=1122209 RepID=A0A1K1UC54_9GAMM|nr:chemoreceptor glutamine deamidase CheD [Marinospirillum alkaliphilum]SFX10422.1 chemotaxis protein CheD [Marinospirillum alkaliphilum DSM 21637]